MSALMPMPTPRQKTRSRMEIASPLRLTAVALSDAGMVRRRNEDSLGYDEELGVFVVCDGMGGHGGGDVASRLAVAAIVDGVRRHHEERCLAASAPGSSARAWYHREAVREALRSANLRVTMAGERGLGPPGMGTTAVVVKAAPDALIIAHVGDSRVYRFSDGRGLDRLTRDHSLLNYRIDEGTLRTARDIEHFEDRNVIVRALGAEDGRQAKPDISMVARHAGDVFLLCTDGLTGLVDDSEIAGVLEAGRADLPWAARQLVATALSRGGDDNVTVMLVRVDDAPARPARPASTRPPTDPT